jgi:hypothetical protein
LEGIIDNRRHITIYIIYPIERHFPEGGLISIAPVHFALGSLACRIDIDGMSEFYFVPNDMIAVQAQIDSFVILIFDDTLMVGF